LEAAGFLATASSLCNACEEVCPVKIPIPQLLRRIRNESYANDSSNNMEGRGYKRNWLEVIAWKAWSIVNTHAWINAAGLKILTTLGLKPPRMGPMKNWTRYRTAPEFARQSLHELVKQNGVDNE
jgi:L-lactate dehydrogenase complex protein LldF